MPDLQRTGRRCAAGANGSGDVLAGRKVVLKLQGPRRAVRRRHKVQGLRWSEDLQERSRPACERSHRNPRWVNYYPGGLRKRSGTHFFTKPEASAGDLLLIFQEIPHAHFSRKGADLFYKKTISLAEALVGFSFKLAHLDGKQYTVYSRAGEVVGDHSKKIVRGLGMPFFKN